MGRFSGRAQRCDNTDLARTGKAHCDPHRVASHRPGRCAAGLTRERPVELALEHRADLGRGQRLAAADCADKRHRPGRVEQLLATGQPVFVDFTAAWCVTCQYNKKTTLAHADVLADLDARRVALLRADWTRRDPAITAALAALGRNGVPVYVLYKAGAAPVVLSEILSVADLRATLARL